MLSVSHQLITCVKSVGDKQARRGKVTSIIAQWELSAVTCAALFMRCGRMNACEARVSLL